MPWVEGKSKEELLAEIAKLDEILAATCTSVVPWGPYIEEKSYSPKFCP